MVQDAEAHADDDRRLRELAEARNNAENAAYQAERQVKDLADNMDESQKTEIEGLIKDLRDSLTVRGPGRAQREDRGAADGVPQGLRGDVREGLGAAAVDGNGAGADAPARGLGDAEEEVVDAEVVDEGR